MKLSTSRKPKEVESSSRAQPTPGPRRQFDAFISYKREPDGPLAASLQRALHQFAKPWNRRQALRIARDTTTFGAAASLPDEIRQALDSSEFFILLASPEAAAARWVGDEVGHWCATRDPRNILIALAAGTLEWDAAAGDFRQTADHPLPQELKGVFSPEPLWVDLRWARQELAPDAALSQADPAGRGARLKDWLRDRLARPQSPLARDPRFHDAVATLAARIRNVPKDTLYSEDLRLHRRTIRLAWTVIVVLGALLLVASLLGLLAARQRNVTLEQSAALALRAYNTQMQLIQREWEATPTQTGRVLELLAETAASAERGFEWGYWNALCHQDYRTLRGHTSRLTSVALSEGGRRIVTGSWDGTARVWERESGRELRALRSNDKWVKGVAVTRDGGRVLAGSDDGTARLWDVETGQLLRELPGHKLGVEAVALSPDGAHAVTVAFGDHILRVWELATGRQLLSLAGHSNSVTALTFSADGRWLLSASKDGSARVWDFAAGRERLALPARLVVSCYAVAMSGDGRFVAAGYGDDTAKVWSFPDGKEVRTLSGHGSAVTGVAFSPDGQRIFTASGDRTLRVWEAESGEPLRTLHGHTDGIAALALSSDGLYLATASDDATAKVWDARGDAGVITLEGFHVSINAAAISEDGRFAAVSIFTGVTQFYDLQTRQVAREFEDDYCIAISPDGGQVAVGALDGTARVWSSRRGWQPLVLAGHGETVISISMSADGRRVLTGSGDGTARLWDAETGAQLRAFGEAGGPTVTAVALSPDGRLAAVASDDLISLLSVADGRKTGSLSGHQNTVDAISFSRDGRYLVSGGADDTARVWDAAAAKEVLTLKGHTGSLTAVGFLPDASRIVTGGNDDTIRLWDAKTGQQLLQLSPQMGSVRAIAVPSGSRHLYTAHEKGVIRVWTANMDRL